MFFTSDKISETVVVVTYRGIKSIPYLTMSFHSRANEKNSCDLISYD